MGNSFIPTNIDEYLRKRLMPVEGAIPQLPGIEMYGNSIPAGAVGGDLFEYINFQQRYDIDGRIQLALKRSQEYLEKLAVSASPRNSVDGHVNWLKSRAGFSSEKETAYREARSSEQVRVAEDLRELRSTAGVLLVDAEGHGIIAAKIASTVHDTFQALMLSELDHRGKTTGIVREAEPAPGSIIYRAQCTRAKFDGWATGDRHNAVWRNPAIRQLSICEFRTSAATRLLCGIWQIRGIGQEPDGAVSTARLANPRRPS